MNICWTMSCLQAWFQKASGQAMILTHHVNIFTGGEIELNTEEHAEYKWVPLAELDALEPKIDNIPAAAKAAKRLFEVLTLEDFVVM